MPFTRTDLRHALRTLAQRPVVTALAVFTLALAIGATTAMFSVVDAVLLRPLPYPDAGRLVALWEKDRDGLTTNTSFATLADVRERSRTLAGTAAMSYWNPTLTGPGTPERLEALRVSHEFFEVLGVRPAIGRDFRPEEDRPDTRRVVLLSHGLWQRRFASDPTVVGTTIPLNGVPHLVAGVLPREFESVFSTNVYKPAEIWAPLGYDASLPWACRTCRHLRAVARVKPGASLEAARAEPDTISAALVQDHPQDYPAAGMILRPLVDDIVGPVRASFWVLMGAVTLVLLIACANVASLLLGRARERQREIAIRRALGAGRGRIVLQLILESFLLALAGGVLGVLFADWGVAALVAQSPPNIPRLGNAGVDLRVLLVALGVSTVASLTFGLAPALLGSRLDVMASLKAGAAEALSSEKRGMHGMLLAADVAMALVLLIGTGLLVGSVERLLAVDAGFDQRGLLTAEISVSGPAYKEDPAYLRFYERVLGRVQAIPGVRGAALVSQLPLGGNLDGHGMHIEDRPSDNPANDPDALRYAVSSDYFRVMGIPLRGGRRFDEHDREGAPAVVVINETFARRVRAGEDPLGRRIRMGGDDSPMRTVVGMVGDVRHAGLDAPPAMQVYLPQAQWVDSDMILVLRAFVDPGRLAAAVRQGVWAVDPEQPVSYPATMDGVRAVSMARRRFALTLLSAFGGIALVLTLAGLYGVLSHSVVQRTREIGVRLALGARGRQVMALVLADAFRMVGAGLLAGTVLAAGSTHLLSGLLFGITPIDPATFLLVPSALALCALFAAYGPARRATLVDPLVALRQD